MKTKREPLASSCERRILPPQRFLASSHEGHWRGEPRSWDGKGKGGGGPRHTVSQCLSEQLMIMLAEDCLCGAGWGRVLFLTQEVQVLLETVLK